MCVCVGGLMCVCVCVQWSEMERWIDMRIPDIMCVSADFPGQGTCWRL